VTPALGAEGIAGALYVVGLLLKKLPGIWPHVVEIWGANNLGPLPPSVEEWEAADAKVDAELKASDR